MPTRNEQLAQLAMLSGDNVLQPFGGAMLDDEQQQRALRQRQTEFEHERAQPMHLGDGFLRDPSTGAVSQDPAIAEFEALKHRQGLELFNAQQDAVYRREQRARRNISGPELANLADLDSTLQLGRDTLDQLGENPEAKEPFADLATGAVRSVWPDMGNLIESAHKTDEESDTLNKMRRFIAGVRKSELGSALTGYELEKGSEWDPTAAGIGADEAQRRLENLIEYLGQEYETIRAGRPLPNYGGDEDEPAAGPTAEQEWTIDENGNPVRVR